MRTLATLVVLGFFGAASPVLAEAWRAKPVLELGGASQLQGAPAPSPATAPSRKARKTCQATGRSTTSALPPSSPQQLPLINGHEPLYVIHNDAVVHGLSEVPNMKDVQHWAVMTIGTGLANARFTNRTDD
jgi:hypothetical protein